MTDVDTIVRMEWQGFLRKDGRKGIRNSVVVIYTVQCAQFVAHAVAQGERDAHVIGFPGCYDNQYAINLLLALARHPNVGGVLAIGLGCEYTQPERIMQAVRNSGRPAEAFFIQEHGGTERSITYGKELLANLRERADATPRVAMTWKDLTVGCECGGSDGTSGLAGNPVVGRFYDWIVERGGTAIFEEIVEMIGLRSLLSGRAADPAARLQLEAAYDKAEGYCKAVRQYSVSPGNFAGGLTTMKRRAWARLPRAAQNPSRVSFECPNRLRMLASG